jgi:hypothetical protein
VDLDALDLRAWRAMSDADTDRLAASVARATGFTAVRSTPGAWHFVREDRGGRAEPYVFVPASGPVTLGYDGAAFRPTPAQAASYARDAELLELPGDIQGLVDEETSPSRVVEVGPMLVAVEPVAVEGLMDRAGGPLDVYADLVPEIQRWLATFGAALPSPDQWEYCRGAGASTLWAWGDTEEPAPDWPGTGFDLTFDLDPYDYELTDDEAVLCGGDGGSAACGGVGRFLAALPQATAYRPVDADTLASLADEHGHIRPVLPIR